MSSKRIVAGTALALAGVMAAIGIGLLANTISGDSVGLSAEPLSAGDALAPSATQRQRAARRREVAQRRETRAAQAPGRGQTTPPGGHREPNDRTHHRTTHHRHHGR